MYAFLLFKLRAMWSCFTQWDAFTPFVRWGVWLCFMVTLGSLSPLVGNYYYLVICVAGFGHGFVSSCVPRGGARAYITAFIAGAVLVAALLFVDSQTGYLIPNLFAFYPFIYFFAIPFSFSLRRIWIRFHNEYAVFLVANPPTPKPKTIHF